MPFLTLEDPNLKIKGSRDPLGIVPVWSSFGRHVVRNLTTQSTSVRGFTTLLLGRYFAALLIDDGDVSPEDALDVFMHMEQIAAYARHVGHRTEGEIRGIERVKSFLAETDRRPTIQSGRRGAILADQKVYGLWGLYSVPARTSGLIPVDRAGVTEVSRRFIEKLYLPKLEPALKPLRRLLAAGGTLDVRPGKSELFERLVEVLPEKYTAEEVEFYGHYLRDGREVPGGRLEQARFRELLVANVDLEASQGNARDDLVALRKEAQKVDQNLAVRLQRILDLEAFLAPASALFDCVLASRAQHADDVGAKVRDQWGRVPNLDAKVFGELAEEITKATSPEIAAVAGRCHGQLADGDFPGVVHSLVEWNRLVMQRRHAGPWVAIGSDGRLDVRLPLAEQTMPSADELPTLWSNSYFIDSLRSVTRQLRRAA